jgi:ADP-ribosylation factor protein 6
LNENVNTYPCEGFNFEMIEYKRLKFLHMGLSGKKKLRPLWTFYFRDCNCLIYVIDSSNLERIEEAAQELKKMLINPELKNSCLLLYANKQDLDCALSPNKITEKLELNQLKNKIWHVQGSSGINGMGLVEGLDWVEKQLFK